jgi:pimeloyl-ACP methyl ester carboxylesterase
MPAFLDKADQAQKSNPHFRNEETSCSAQNHHSARASATQSPATRPRRRRGSWIRRGLLIMVAGLLTLAAMGTVYRAIATQIDRRTYPPPSNMVDVGTHRLHINCVGEGSPTVILEAASPGMSADWVRVQQQVSQTTRVCAYDRAGLGWSEAGPEPRDARQISSELHCLLNAAGTQGPYVLVGHSYGGLYARMYADRYPADVAGMVLVDSSHPEQFTRSPEGRAMYQQTRRMGRSHSLADTTRSSPSDQVLSCAPRLTTSAARADRSVQLLDATAGHNRGRIPGYP